MKPILIILLALGIQACSESIQQPMSAGAQCITHGYWCEWPICGPCAGHEPRTGYETWRPYRGMPWVKL